jgi:hypothetical protein
MWREAVVAYCEVLSLDLIGGTEEDDSKRLIIVCIRDKIWTENQKNSKHSYEPFSSKVCKNAWGLRPTPPDVVLHGSCIKLR